MIDLNQLTAGLLRASADFLSADQQKNDPMLQAITTNFLGVLAVYDEYLKTKQPDPFNFSQEIPT